MYDGHYSLNVISNIHDKCIVLIFLNFKYSLTKCFFFPRVLLMIKTPLNEINSIKSTEVNNNK